MSNGQAQDFPGALERQWDDYRKKLKAARQEISEETIHDLRVAARRFQALLAFLRALDPHPRIKKIRRFLRNQLEELDELHDKQVMVQEANQRVESLPGIAPFRDYLQAKSEKLANTARKDLRKSKPSDLKKRIQRIRRVAKKHSDDEELLEHLLQAVDAAHARTLGAFLQLDAQDPTTVHRLRIAFKKFRYMIEMIQPLLPGYPPSHPDEMHNYQFAMGRIHDTTVFLNTLKEFEQSLRQHGKGQAPAFEPKSIEVYYQKRLDELIQAYFQRKDEFNSFWRTAPEQPFPWENSHEPVHRTPRNRRTTGQQQQRNGRQPAGAHRRRPKKVPAGSTGTQPTGDPDRSDPDQSVPTGS